MYAVIETSGRQYRVELGSEIELDQMDAEPGSTIELGRVLLIADGEDAHIGQPIVDGARVTGEVLRNDRGDKIIVFKYRPKARRRVKKGHRSSLTVVRVSDIVLNGRSAASEAEKQAKKDADERAAAEKEAARQAAADKALADKLAAERAAEEEAAEAKADEGEDKQKPASRKSPSSRSGASGSKTKKENAAEETKADDAAGDEPADTDEAKAKPKRSRAKPAQASTADTDDKKDE